MSSNSTITTPPQYKCIWLTLRCEHTGQFLLFSLSAEVKSIDWSSEYWFVVRVAGRYQFLTDSPCGVFETEDQKRSEKKERYAGLIILVVHLAPRKFNS